MTLRIGFIGAGKAGCSLGKYLTVRTIEVMQETIENKPVKPTDTDSAGAASILLNSPQEKTLVEVAGYYSKSPESASYAAELTGSTRFDSLDEIVSSCDLIFLSVPDGKIEEVFQKLISESRKTGLSLDNKIFAHLSGSLGSKILTLPAYNKNDKSNGTDSDENISGNFDVFSLHPACAIPNKTDAWLGLRDAVFVYEGSEKCKSLISPLLDVMGNQIGSIDPDKKTLYHAACVFLSNLGVGLAYEGHDLLTSCGMDNKTADAFLSTLFLGNAKNVAEKGPVEALTGPAERGDVSVIKKHMTELGKLKENSGSKALSIYTELTEILIKIAKEKHPDRDYQDLTDLLK